MFRTAEGGSEDKLASIAIVNIIVTDENDNAPRFRFPPYEFELDSLNDTEIGKVEALDDDLGSGGIVKFRLLGQIEVRSFLFETVVFTIYFTGLVTTRSRLMVSP